MAKTESVTAQMTEILNDYSKEVKDVSRKSVKTTSKDTAQRLRDTSAKKTGEYAQGWGAKRIDEDTYVTYNRTMPGLTHLLEKGHVIVNKKGQFGRVPGDHKIKEAEEWGASELEMRITRGLS